VVVLPWMAVDVDLPLDLEVVIPLEISAGSSTLDFGSRVSNLLACLARILCL
jgi:hypothetical protein